jgi:hypothetical protein
VTLEGYTISLRSASQFQSAHPGNIHSLKCVLHICTLSKELPEVGCAPRLPVALPYKQLHVAVYMVCTITPAAGRAVQVIQLFNAQAQIQLAAAVLLCSTAERTRADDLPWLQRKPNASRQGAQFKSSFDAADSAEGHTHACQLSQNNRHTGG